MLILGPRFFLIYINNLSNNLSSNPELFAAVPSGFFWLWMIKNQSVINLNYELEQISNWDFQWKMSFNPKINKPAQKDIFSSQLQKSNHRSLTFNGTCVTPSEIQKNLGMLLDSNLDFMEHIQNKLNKINSISKTIELLCKLQNILTRPPLITIYKSLIRSHLDYGYIIYNEVDNASFHQKLESMQYNAALTIIGATRETSIERSFMMNFLKAEDGIVNFVAFNKFSTLSHLSIYSTSTVKITFITRNDEKLPHFKVKHNYFKNTFFPLTAIEWNKLDLNIHNSEGLSSFKGNTLEFIRPSKNIVCLCNNRKGIILLTRLKLVLSHLREHRFKHSHKKRKDSLETRASFSRVL